jgi:hypothetical protein
VLISSKFQTTHTVVDTYSDLTLQEKHPLIIPKKYHIAYLLIQHFHQEVKHQGRLLTEGAIRRKALMKLDEDISLMISICMARMTKQVKITAHLFD